MMKVWQVVIVGCHPTSMLGTKLILEEGGELKVLGMYSTWDEGASIVREKNPELVLADYHMPEGNIESVLLNMKKSSPNSHFVVMTDEDGRDLLQPLIELGASGIFSKGASPHQLLQLILGLRVGFLSMPLEWIEKGSWPISTSKGLDDVLQLTQTEMFIMERIVQGITYDKIALEIAVSRRSIDNYLRKIYVKLDVSTRAQAIEKFALFSRQNRQIYA
ncbi:two-component system response regulator [Paenibacillus sp. VTT E-133280]|jgi:DNA-binding NarL/FixJ family response regulator|uniref:DNA-binding response regulator n=1 Tax=Paenibacillus TaxID=44249 RepID=UPI0004F723D9|nr:MULTISPECIES: response regulator transcription factor [unclassified Paenibacillus]HBS46652.1 DNA-binding response regulator [Paenibacillus sp.]AIQ22864.1 chemotaxis protein CheY [Paenibacillus sp. FSL H7-0737]KAA1186163.1 response regulator transcription factor [Paenibacillus sp. B2(2019)]MDH6371300.1 NarL family two-component system response regulator YdfI [Paenibacillus sp. PastF-3]OZQ65885.1 two-component system response regulator [Paenibacillus sp. VTT E-133280]